MSRSRRRLKQPSRHDLTFFGCFALGGFSPGGADGESGGAQRRAGRTRLLYQYEEVLNLRQPRIYTGLHSEGTLWYDSPPAYTEPLSALKKGGEGVRTNQKGLVRLAPREAQILRLLCSE